MRRSKDASFVEMCFGDYEGVRLSEFDAQYKEYLRRWRAGDNNYAFPGENTALGARGESPNDVASRGLHGLRALGMLGSSPTAERHICLVAHGRFNKILIAALQGEVKKASDIKQGNTCMNVLDIAADGECVVRALDVRDHLGQVAESPLSPS